MVHQLYQSSSYLEEGLRRLNAATRAAVVDQITWMSRLGFLVGLYPMSGPFYHFQGPSALIWQLTASTRLRCGASDYEIEGVQTRLSSPAHEREAYCCPDRCMS